MTTVEEKTRELLEAYPHGTSAAFRDAIMEMVADLEAQTKVFDFLNPGVVLELF